MQQERMQERLLVTDGDRMKYTIFMRKMNPFENQAKIIIGP